MNSLNFGEIPTRYYGCPICGKDVPFTARQKIPQAYGLVRANHLRSHDLWTSSMTLEQKNDKQYLVALWKLQEYIKMDRAMKISLLFTVPRKEVWMNRKDRKVAKYLDKFDNLIHCPPDCLRRKTCFKGRVLPSDKWSCYRPVDYKTFIELPKGDDKEN